MNTKRMVAITVGLLTGLGMYARGAEPVRYFARSGSKMRIEGTSNIHDWQMENTLIGGFLEVGENFPTEPGQAVKPGRVGAKAEPFATVRSFKSLKKDGTLYSDQMDNIMHEKMKSEANPRVIFKLREFVLKTVPASKDAPYEFEATGDVLAAGETKSITMPVKVMPMPDKKLRISGTANLRMSDFKIEPPSPNIPGGTLIKTADEVKVLFEWIVAPRGSSTK